eukprot:226830-Karenia_brevis.AAC.1
MDGRPSPPGLPGWTTFPLGLPGWTTSPTWITWMDGESFFISKALTWVRPPSPPSPPGSNR